LSSQKGEYQSKVIESSTTGKVLSRMLSGKYEVHMVAPPERRVSIKTDAERIVMEDMFNYLRRANFTVHR